MDPLLRDDLENLLEHHQLDSISKTPSPVFAEFLIGCINAYTDLMRHYPGEQLRAFNSFRSALNNAGYEATKKIFSSKPAKS